VHLRPGDAPGGEQRAQLAPMLLRFGQ
jgi:hypothetical protein